MFRIRSASTYQPSFDMTQLTSIRGRFYNVERDGWPTPRSPGGIYHIQWEASDDPIDVARYSRGFLSGFGVYRALTLSASRHRITIQAADTSPGGSVPELSFPANHHIVRAMARALNSLANELEKQE